MAAEDQASSNRKQVEGNERVRVATPRCVQQPPYSSFINDHARALEETRARDRLQKMPEAIGLGGRKIAVLYDKPRGQDRFSSLQTWYVSQF